ncbi:hypothetical protein ACNAW0_16035 [Micromonospora sp. SL1-18]|uniref:hypothetical protein n=1 Tax=Micromonospora sp. SL1-18 TaxID=3399128 RepID=UPI003A4D831E
MTAQAAKARAPAAEASTRQSVGGENDPPSRQLARFVSDVAENGAAQMRVRGKSH